MTIVGGGGFTFGSLNDIIKTNLQKFTLIIILTLSMLNFYLVFNLFNKKTLLKYHKEDLYLLIISLILILLVLFNTSDILNIVIAVLSSLANSGITLLNEDNNLSLYFLLITVIGGSLIFITE